MYINSTDLETLPHPHMCRPLSLSPIPIIEWRHKWFPAVVCLSLRVRSRLHGQEQAHHRWEGEKRRGGAGALVLIRVRGRR